ncbi:MAG: glutamine amidotransferase [Marinicella sp.]
MLLIIQTGDPVALAQPFGSFADYFIRGMDVSGDQVQVFNVHQNQTLPKFNSNISGIIITGSAAMVTEHTFWMRQTQHWLELAIDAKIPILGVCFGHQLLADLLGGQVDSNPKGRNMGLSVCRLNDAGSKDPLMAHINPKLEFNTLVSHQQAVINLPQSVTLLAVCEKDQNHIFSYENNVWGVQFHPEWTIEIMQAYIKQRQLDLQVEGFDTQLMIEQLQSCNHARGLLNQFKKIVGLN